jgi:PPP family 3-phenylpropionic acid transporter
VVRLAAFYLFYFGVLGTLVPYWGPYLQHLGFHPTAIGELMAIFMGTRVVAPLLFGWLSDRLGHRMRLVRAGALATVVTFAGVYLGKSFAWLAVVMGVFSFAWSAVLPPFEAVTLNHLGPQASRYGRIRLWGSVGFILGVGLVGELLERHSMALLVPICLGLFGAIFLTSLTVTEHSGLAPDASPPPLRRLLWRPELISLLGASLLMQASHGPYYTFFTIFCVENGYPKNWTGWLWALGVLTEIGVFFTTNRLLERFSARRLMLTSLMLTAGRWLLTGLFVQQLGVLLLAQSLHAFSFGIFHAVNIHMIHRLFTGRHQSLGQALYASIAFGGGSALGSLAAGHAWETLGSHETFLAAAALPALAIGITALWFRPASPPR